MTNRVRTAAVKQVPERVNSKQLRQFLEELKSCLDGDRPCLVLDCSQVRRVDSMTIHLLLCSLEEALKHNGDAKLAAVPAESEALLKQAGMGRLFEMYATVDDAVGSFRRLRANSDSARFVSSVPFVVAESAA